MELKILDWIQALHNPVTDVLFVWITRLGNVGMIWTFWQPSCSYGAKRGKPAISWRQPWWWMSFCAMGC